LPVDERHPVILNNDGPNDNWQGEYALLLASAQRLELAAIVINTGGSWSNLDANMAGWNNLVAAARASGMHNVPDPLASAGPSLTRPENGDIDATTPNGSSGAAAHRRSVASAGKALPTRGRRNRRTPDRRGRCLPARSHAAGSRRHRLVARHDQWKWRAHGHSQRGDGCLG
jgi:hypothetical protein